MCDVGCLKVGTHIHMYVYLYVQTCYICVYSHINAFGFLFIIFESIFYKWYWPVIFFSCISANFSHQSFTVHIKWSEDFILWMSLYKAQIICFLNIPGILPTIWIWVEINISDLCKREDGVGRTPGRIWAAFPLLPGRPLPAPRSQQTASPPVPLPGKHPSPFARCHVRFPVSSDCTGAHFCLRSGWLVPTRNVCEHLLQGYITCRF